MAQPTKLSVFSAESLKTTFKEYIVDYDKFEKYKELARISMAFVNSVMEKESYSKEEIFQMITNIHIANKEIQEEIRLEIFGSND
jgi:nitrogenase subunit NifH